MSYKSIGPPALQGPISHQNFTVRIVTSHLCCAEGQKGHGAVRGKVRTELGVRLLETLPCPVGRAHPVGDPTRLCSQVL